ncbi:hypothetical protein QBC36DRAFT_83450 [Triangularia setosa]|uniref:Uncharacterized protein n=1 Tax=Triangularia setosa TaxID=2587417 RepID=A0AAN7ABU1_9PEZI|nr:hypothetical protein QBC36DRAFT_83450 [Podospora setosa]
MQEWKLIGHGLIWGLMLLSLQFMTVFPEGRRLTVLSQIPSRMATQSSPHIHPISGPLQKIECSFGWNKLWVKQRWDDPTISPLAGKNIWAGSTLPLGPSVKGPTMLYTCCQSHPFLPLLNNTLAAGSEIAAKNCFMRSSVRVCLHCSAIPPLMHSIHSLFYLCVTLQKKGNDINLALMRRNGDPGKKDEMKLDFRSKPSRKHPIHTLPSKKQNTSHY